MNIFRISLLGIFLLFCQSVFAQAVNSSVTIRIDRGNYVVSGVVSNSSIKNSMIEKIKTELGANADFSRLDVQPNAGDFEIGWSAELDAALQKIKSWKSGVFIFSNRKRAPQGDLPQEIIGARFSLANGREASLEDYKNKVVVLFFNEAWNYPGNLQMEELNKFYPQISSRNVEIISLSIETSADEKKRFRQLHKMFATQYRFGWTEEKLFDGFVKISKVPAIPQTFVILNGKYYGFFIGYAPKIMDDLKQTIIKTLDENNL